jgi:hypothetical protein
VVRRPVLFAFAVAALLLPASPAGAGARTQKLVRGSALAGAHGQVRDRIVLKPARAAQAALSGWGGTYLASTGDHVTVYSSLSYPVDDAVNQAYADFLAGLVHGSELSHVRTYFAPLAEVGSICGDEADGCYFPDTQQLVAIGEDDQYATVEEVLTHEYGHHVARNRVNTPWEAIAWGTKRWASYENVCARSKAGTAFPGDEAENYLRNPGESFAESFLQLNEARAGLARTPWFYDPGFQPDDAALAAIEADVIQPWTAATTTTWSGRLARAGAAATRALATPLDGVLTLRLKAPAGSKLSLYDTHGKLVASSRTAVRATVCGERSLMARVAGSRAGAFTVAVSTP